MEWKNAHEVCRANLKRKSRTNNRCHRGNKDGNFSPDSVGVSLRVTDKLERFLTFKCSALQHPSSTLRTKRMLFFKRLAHGYEAALIYDNK